MADRIVVMHDGVIEQIGTPLELYDRPDNLFVAQFIGSPAMNIVQGTLRRSNGDAHVEAAGGIRWPLGAGAGDDGQAVTLRRAARAPRRSRATERPRRAGRDHRRRADRAPKRSC